MEVVGQASDIELRKGLPLELGSDFSSSSSERTCKEAVVQKVSALCQRLITPTTVARAVDRVCCPCVYGVSVVCEDVRKSVRIV